MTIGNQTFCLTLYLTGVHFRGELQHFGHVRRQKIKCRPIRIREIGGARLRDELYARIHLHLELPHQIQEQKTLCQYFPDVFCYQ